MVFKKYWKEILFFGGILAVYIAGIAPDMTWMSLGGDQLNYVIAAKNFSPAGLVGYPLFVIIGWVFERLPFNDFWNLAFLSALSTVATCIVIFLTIKLLVGQAGPTAAAPLPTGSSQKSSLPCALAPYIGAAVYASAFIVWTQSVIPEVYTLTSLIITLMVYFTLKKKYWVAAGMMALGIGVHPISIFVIGCCLIYILIDKRDFGFLLKLVGVTMVGFLFYLQRYVTSDPTQNVFFLDNPLTMVLRAANGFFTLPVIPLEPTLERGSEVLAMVLTSVGFSAPLWFFAGKKREVYFVGAVALITFATYAISFYPQWITYLVFPVAMLSILAGAGAARFPVKKIVPVFLAIPFIFMAVNIIFYDLGRSVDGKEETTARMFYNELSQLPDKSIVVVHTWGHPGVGCYYYCSENKDRIDYINWNTIGEPDRYPYYVPYQEARGIEIPPFPKDLVANRQYGVSNFARDLQILNPERSVYVAYLKKRDTEMEFGLVPAGSYYYWLNDVPPSKRNYVGG